MRGPARGSLLRGCFLATQVTFPWSSGDPDSLWPRSSLPAVPPGWKAATWKLSACCPVCGLVTEGPHSHRGVAQAHSLQCLIACVWWPAIYRQFPLSICAFSLNPADTARGKKEKVIIAHSGLGAGFLSPEKGAQLSPGSLLPWWEARVRFGPTARLWRGGTKLQVGPREGAWGLWPHKK